MRGSSRPISKRSGASLGDVDLNLPANKCHVCFESGEFSDGRNSGALVKCAQCGTSTHTRCYGCPPRAERLAKEGKWLCDPCARGVHPVCMLCLKRGGAMKQIKTPQRDSWGHVVCAVWIKETYLEDLDAMGPIMGYETIDTERWKLKCMFCNKKRRAIRSAMIQCTEDKCYRAFHPMCAYLTDADLMQSVEIDTQSLELDLTSWCPGHKHLGPKFKHKLSHRFDRHPIIASSSSSSRGMRSSLDTLPMISASASDLASASGSGCAGNRIVLDDSTTDAASPLPPSNASSRMRSSLESLGGGSGGGGSSSALVARRARKRSAWPRGTQTPSSISASESASATASRRGSFGTSGSQMMSSSSSGSGFGKQSAPPPPPPLHGTNASSDAALKEEQFAAPSRKRKRMKFKGMIMGGGAQAAAAAAAAAAATNMPSSDNYDDPSASAAAPRRLTRSQTSGRAENLAVHHGRRFVPRHGYRGGGSESDGDDVVVIDGPPSSKRRRLYALSSIMPGVRIGLNQVSEGGVPPPIRRAQSDDALVSTRLAHSHSQQQAPVASSSSAAPTQSQGGGDMRTGVGVSTFRQMHHALDPNSTRHSSMSPRVQLQQAQLARSNSVPSTTSQAHPSLPHVQKQQLNTPIRGIGPPIRNPIGPPVPNPIAPPVHSAAMPRMGIGQQPPQGQQQQPLLIERPLHLPGTGTASSLNKNLLSAPATAAATNFAHPASFLMQPPSAANQTGGGGSAPSFPPMQLNSQNPAHMGYIARFQSLQSHAAIVARQIASEKDRMTQLQTIERAKDNLTTTYLSQFPEYEQQQIKYQLHQALQVEYHQNKVRQEELLQQKQQIAAAANARRDLEWEAHRQRQQNLQRSKQELENTRQQREQLIQQQNAADKRIERQALLHQQQERARKMQEESRALERQRDLLKKQEEDRRAEKQRVEEKRRREEEARRQMQSSSSSGDGKPRKLTRLQIRENALKMGRQRLAERIGKVLEEEQDSVSPALASSNGIRDLVTKTTHGRSQPSAKSRPMSIAPNLKLSPQSSSSSISSSSGSSLRANALSAASSMSDRDKSSSRRRRNAVVKMSAEDEKSVNAGEREPTRLGRVCASCGIEQRSRYNKLRECSKCKEHVHEMCAEPQQPTDGDDMVDDDGVENLNEQRDDAPFVCGLCPEITAPTPPETKCSICFKSQAITEMQRCFVLKCDKRFHPSCAETTDAFKTYKITQQHGGEKTIYFCPPHRRTLKDILRSKCCSRSVSGLAPMSQPWYTCTECYPKADHGMSVVRRGMCQYCKRKHEKESGHSVTLVAGIQNAVCSGEDAGIEPSVFGELAHSRPDVLTKPKPKLEEDGKGGDAATAIEIDDSDDDSDEPLLSLDFVDRPVITGSDILRCCPVCKRSAKCTLGAFRAHLTEHEQEVNDALNGGAGHRGDPKTSYKWRMVNQVRVQAQSKLRKLVEGLSEELERVAVES